jgi:hypothetical protein
MASAIALVLLLAGAARPAQATQLPVMRVVRPAHPGPSLLRNAGFEQAPGGDVVAWTPWQKGFRIAAGAGRGGSQAVLCANDATEGEYGAGQTVTLNRATIAPLVVSGWSRAENVSGSPDAGYSLYVDLAYADGTPLWGQTAEFRCGTHDWERREMRILPAKPVKSLTVYCLFRGHTGRVWFDDVRVEEERAEGDALQFQGARVRIEGRLLRRAERGEPRQRLPPGIGPRGRRGNGATVVTRDGLRLAMQGGAVTSLTIGGRELAVDTPSGFLARDVAANSDVYAFRDDLSPSHRCRSLPLAPKRGGGTGGRVPGAGCQEPGARSQEPGAVAPPWDCGCARGSSRGAMRSSSRDG